MRYSIQVLTIGILIMLISGCMTEEVRKNFARIDIEKTELHNLVKKQGEQIAANKEVVQKLKQNNAKLDENIKRLKNDRLCANQEIKKNRSAITRNIQGILKNRANIAENTRSVKKNTLDVAKNTRNINKLSFGAQQLMKNFVEQADILNTHITEQALANPMKAITRRTWRIGPFETFSSAINKTITKQIKVIQEIIKDPVIIKGEPCEIRITLFIGYPDKRYGTVLNGDVINANERLATQRAETIANAFWNNTGRIISAKNYSRKNGRIYHLGNHAGHVLICAELQPIIIIENRRM